MVRIIRTPVQKPEDHEKKLNDLLEDGWSPVGLNLYIEDGCFYNMLVRERRARPARSVEELMQISKEYKEKYKI